MTENVSTSIKLTPKGVELILTALNHLPRGQVDELFNDIVNQYRAEIARLQAEVAVPEVDTEEA
jgi:hypothetical protein